ncbi:hypothetical protein [Gordonibacter massiliensis (ex Traore et al. 2017)]|uniref:tRNA nuclease CdiA C-terminal domain-containing protein n=1 Tax=Gordonibacter massiliensis (ex Traore et al. 2017) TaxID=1841863 RepID=A0A842J9Y4_9ACTN|nr:hypothetical protein [Gordonibacter massiliensis (ex Traore et al. 2017)]MBC2888932.1 hypothetical protein [Gordonibacter massiliensis (ex Traore et al. 2017)]
MKNNQGKIIIAPDINLWEQEYETAQALAKAGLTVEFVRRSEENRRTSADAVINGLVWEMKAPKADNARAIDRNLRRALHQSANIIFDSRRMKKLPDAVIERELRKHAQEVRSIKHLWFINRRQEIIDIK